LNRIEDKKKTDWKIIHNTKIDQMRTTKRKNELDFVYILFNKLYEKKEKKNSKK